MSSTASIINTISDDKALVLFKTIALKDSDGESLRSKIKLTRKQFYSRMSDLIRVGLVKRKSGKYSLTTCGRVIYNAQAVIGAALKDYWKLKVIDSIELDDTLSEEEYSKLVNSLIDNEKIKRIILTKNHFYI
jgi:predicted transcriptional regulator